MFRLDPLVPLNLDELSQKELTPLLPRHKRAGGLQNPRINFRSASAQRVDWKAPIAAAILISATAKVFTNTRLLPAEDKVACSGKESEEAQRSTLQGLGTILPSPVAAQAGSYPACGRGPCGTVLRPCFPNPFSHCLFISRTSRSWSTG